MSGCKIGNTLSLIHLFTQIHSNREKILVMYMTKKLDSFLQFKIVLTTGNQQNIKESKNW